MCYFSALFFSVFFVDFFSAVAFGAAKCIEFCEFCFAANTRIQGQMTSAKHFFVLARTVVTAGQWRTSRSGRGS